MFLCLRYVLRTFIEMQKVVGLTVDWLPHNGGRIARAQLDSTVIRRRELHQVRSLAFQLMCICNGQYTLGFCVIFFGAFKHLNCCAMLLNGIACEALLITKY